MELVRDFQLGTSPSIRERGTAAANGSDAFDPVFYSKYYRASSASKPVGWLRAHYTLTRMIGRRFRNATELTEVLQEKHGKLPADFDPALYILMHEDLRQLYTEDWQGTVHYLTHGREEQRAYRARQGRMRAANSAAADPDAAAAPLDHAVTITLIDSAAPAELWVAIDSFGAPGKEFARYLLAPPIGWSTRHQKRLGFSHFLTTTGPYPLTLHLERGEHLFLLRHPQGPSVRIQSDDGHQDIDLRDAAPSMMHVTPAGAASGAHVWLNEPISNADSLESAARKLGVLESNTRTLALCVPRWRGVRASTEATFARVLHVPADNRVPEHVSPSEIHEAVRRIREENPDNLVISGGDVFMTDIARGVKADMPGIRIILLWHSNVLQAGEQGDQQILNAWLELHRDGVLQSIVVVRQGMEHSLKAMGIPSAAVANVVPRTSQIVAVPHPADRIHVGLWLSGSSAYRKKPTASIYALSLLKDQGVLLSTAGATAEDIDLIRRLKIPVHFMSRQPIARDELLSRISTTHMSLYVTVSECAPMVPLESWSVGVPCLIGPSCHFFDDGGVLEKALVIADPSDPCEIADKILNVSRNRADIMRALDAFLERRNTVAAANLGSILTARGDASSAAHAIAPATERH